MACPHCPYTTNNNGNLKQHIIRRHTSENLQKCPHCPFQSNYNHTMRNHINLKHTKEDLHSCDLCKFQGPTQAEVRKHVKQVHEKQERMLECSYCEYKTSYARTLDCHIKKKHTGQDLLQCPECHFKSALSHDLKMHMRRRHTPDDQHVCTRCDFMGTSKPELDHHCDTVHFKFCDECDYKCAGVNRLEQHKISKHGAQCPYCRFNCVNDRKLLIEHITKNHKEKGLDYVRIIDGKRRKINLLQPQTVNLKPKKQPHEKLIPGPKNYVLKFKKPDPQQIITSTTIREKINVSMLNKMKLNLKKVVAPTVTLEIIPSTAKNVLNIPPAVQENDDIDDELPDISSMLELKFEDLDS